MSGPYHSNSICQGAACFSTRVKKYPRCSMSSLELPRSTTWPSLRHMISSSVAVMRCGSHKDNTWTSFGLPRRAQSIFDPRNYSCSPRILRFRQTHSWYFLILYEGNNLYPNPFLSKSGYALNGFLCMDKHLLGALWKVYVQWPYTRSHPLRDHATPGSTLMTLDPIGLYKLWFFAHSLEDFTSKKCSH